MLFRLDCHGYRFPSILGRSAIKKHMDPKQGIRILHSDSN